MRAVGARRARRRCRSLVGELPGALELIASDLRAGDSLGVALAKAASGVGPVGAALAPVVEAWTSGLCLDDALARFGGCSRSSAHECLETRAAKALLKVLYRSGSPAAVALEGLAASLRERREVQEEARALSTQARMSAMVMGIAPVGAAALSLADGGGSAAVLVGTTPGRVCLAIGLALEALALAWMRRILRVAG